MSDDIFTIAICDDQHVFLTKISVLCDEILSSENIPHNIYTYPSGEELLSHTISNIDLLFLDIEMPGISGLKVLERLVSYDNIWRVVFITSHKDMWKNSFSIKTIGYESKPIEKNTLKNYIDIVFNEKQDNIWITFESGNSEGKLRLSDILYINGDSNYTEVHTKDRKIVLSMTLKKFEEIYAKYPFLRIHKSYIVNMMNISKIGDVASFCNNPYKIPVGRTYHKKAKNKFDEYMLNKFRRRI